MKAIAKSFKTQHIVLNDARLEEGLLLTGAEPPIKKDATQDAIEDCLDRIRRGEDFSSTSKDPVAALGTIWGWTLTSAFDWEWKVFEIWTDDGEYDACQGICGSELRYMYLPEVLFPRMIEHPEIPGPKERFMAIKNGKIAAAPAGALIDLGQQ